MAEIRTNPLEYQNHSPATVTVHALKSNKRPVGFAPWPGEKTKKKKKGKRG